MSLSVEFKFIELQISLLFSPLYSCLADFEMTTITFLSLTHILFYLLLLTSEARFPFEVI